MVETKNSHPSAATAVTMPMRRCPRTATTIPSIAAARAMSSLNETATATNSPYCHQRCRTAASTANSIGVIATTSG